MGIRHNAMRINLRQVSLNLSVAKFSCNKVIIMVKIIIILLNNVAQISIKKFPSSHYTYFCTNSSFIDLKTVTS